MAMLELPYYIQTINTSIGISERAITFEVAAFTFNTFMSQGNFGNLCDTDNFGDPVVVYDTLKIGGITDFAFKLDASNNVLNPAFECFAVSKTGDPVVGGWNYYSTTFTDALGDYPNWASGPTVYTCQPICLPLSRQRIRQPTRNRL